MKIFMLNDETPTVLIKLIITYLDIPDLKIIISNKSKNEYSKFLKTVCLQFNLMLHQRITFLSSWFNTKSFNEEKVTENHTLFLIYSNLVEANKEQIKKQILCTTTNKSIRDLFWTDLCICDPKVAVDLLQRVEDENIHLYVLNCLDFHHVIRSREIMYEEGEIEGLNEKLDSYKLYDNWPISLEIMLCFPHRILFIISHYPEIINPCLSILDQLSSLRRKYLRHNRGGKLFDQPEEIYATPVFCPDFINGIRLILLLYIGEKTIAHLYTKTERDILISYLSHCLQQSLSLSELYSIYNKHKNKPYFTQNTSRYDKIKAHFFNTQNSFQSKFDKTYQEMVKVYSP